ncbi:thiamine diphosphokinase [Sporolactobacillus sp. THM7-7]|nr:thiamine diphosphokinase [Sporolactobacillus sp. THM7-7]
MRMVILAGGPEALLPDLHAPRFKGCRWIGADRGTYVLLRNGLRPVRAFGDFDSLNDKEKRAVFGSGLDLSVFPKEKDKTDLELAIDWTLSRHPEECLILGATGGRLDHGLANVQLLLKGIHSRTRLQILDRKNVITVLIPGTYHIKRNPDYPYLSFLAVTEKVTGLTLRGVKYPLSDAELGLGSSLCISNEAEEETFAVSFSEGFLIMMRCSD